MKSFTKASIFIAIFIKIFLCNTIYAQYLINLSASRQELETYESKDSKSLERMIVFGDSLSDTGNLYNKFLKSFPISPPYFEGHFSDGPVWIDFLKKSFDIPSEAMFNYAFGGARIIQSTLPLPGLETQVNKYIEISEQQADANALFIIWAGSNDIVFDKQAGLTPDINKMQETITTQIEKLVEIGAKNFLILQLPNLGYNPEAFELDKKNNNLNYSEKLQKLSNDFNNQLTESLKDLANKHPDTTILSFKTYHFFENIIKNFQDYNFKFTKERCNPNWYATPLEAVCTNPHEYIFWDAVHPSSRSHEILANAALKEMQDIGFDFTKEWNLDDKDKQKAKNHQEAIEKLIAEQTSESIKEIFDSFFR